MSCRKGAVFRVESHSKTLLCRYEINSAVPKKQVSKIKTFVDIIYIELRIQNDGHVSFRLPIAAVRPTLLDTILRKSTIFGDDHLTLFCRDCFTGVCLNRTAAVRR